MKVKCDILLSNSAFRFNLRRYIMVQTTLIKTWISWSFLRAVRAFKAYARLESSVGWCRLPVSKTELKACLISALETKLR